MPEIRHLSQFTETNGWITGKFPNSLTEESMAEVGIKTYLRTEINPYHCHHISTEINIILYGECQFIGNEGVTYTCKKDTIFIIKPHEIFKFVALTDCKLLVLKSHSDPKDKYLWQPPQTQ